MLTCIACSKQLNGGSLPRQQDDDDEEIVATSSKKQAIKTLTTQIKGMALNCKPCSKGSENLGNEESEEGWSEASASERFNCEYQRANPAPGIWRREREIGRVKGLGLGLGLGLGVRLSSGEATPVSVSGRSESMEFMEDDEPNKEWVAQVEPGVLITFVSMPQGGNDLKRIRFSRELFNKWEAQRWWAENYDKVMELYNVQRFNHNTVPSPIPPRDEDEGPKIASEDGIPATPPLSKESLPHNFHHPTGLTYSSSYGFPSTPKHSNISATKLETSSVDASARSSLSGADHSGELSVSNASDIETEWVEQDEPGVYITLRALPSGSRELRRVRFSRERFGEMEARLWWEENKARIREQYL